jgi:hypothetical protein
MSRCDARLKVTSSSPRKICPAVGSSSPAIMRSVVVLPQPEGPSRQKNSPSRTVKLESFTATKSAKALCRFWTRIWAIAALGYLGNFETIVNIATPASVVTNDQVYSASANGCSIMKMPSAITMQAASSSGPRLSHDGQRDEGGLNVLLICAPLRT